MTPNPLKPDPRPLLPRCGEQVEVFVGWCSVHSRYLYACRDEMAEAVAAALAEVRREVESLPPWGVSGATAWSNAAGHWLDRAAVLSALSPEPKP